MGKGTTTTSASTSAPTAQAASAYSNVLGQAANVAATPYQAYSGELVAPINAEQTTGIGGINAAAGQAQPGLAAASTAAQSATSPITAAQIQQYQNPYTQQVVNATEAQNSLTNQQQQAQLAGNNIAQGALGGNRVGVAQANLGAQQSTAENAQIANLYSSGYQQALGAAQAQQQTGLAGANAQANFALQGQNAALTGAGAQLGAGTVQQQTQQAQDTAAQQAYAQQQAYPFQTTQWLAGIDTGVAPGLGSTSTGETTAPPPNLTAQLLGAGVAGAGIAGKAGLFAAAGGRILSRASGGSSNGVSGVPWSNAPTWIPTIGLGNAAPPKASAPSVQTPTTPTINWAQLGNLGSSSKNPLAYGAAVPGAEGPSSVGGAPLVYARGGGVAGYADGGAPDDPFGDDNRQVAYDLLRQSNGIQAPASIPGGEPAPGLGGAAAPVDNSVYTPDAPLRLSGTGAMDDWRAGKPIPPLGTPPAPPNENDDGLPPMITAGTSRAPAGDTEPMGYATAPPMGSSPGLGAAQAPPPQNGTSSLLGGATPNFWTGLTAAGLGMLASRASNFGTAVGEGGIAGLTAYSAAEAHDQKVAEEAAKLSKEAKEHAEEMSLKERTLGENIRTHKVAEEQGWKPSWAPIAETTDPDTGMSKKVYGWVDPNNKAVTDAAGKPIVTSSSPTPPPTSEAPKADATGEDFLKSVPPNRAQRAKMIGDYEESPSDLPTRGGVRAAAVADAKRYNKDFNEQNYQASQRAYTNFVAGPEARTVRSLNAATNHLDTLRQAAAALKNGDIPMVNNWVNHYREMTGSPLTTNFDSIKQAVSSEIAKSVVGGQTALQDRDEMSNRARNADSPAQLFGIFDQFTKLMGGQMTSLRRQYETGTYRKDFDRYLEPSTKKAIDAVSHEDLGKYNFEAPKPPQGAIDQLKKNPASAHFFDEKYGAGASQQYLGQ